MVAVQGGQQPTVYARDHPLHKGDDAQLLPIQIDMRLRAGAAALPGSQVEHKSRYGLDIAGREHGQIAGAGRRRHHRAPPLRGRAHGQGGIAPYLDHGQAGLLFKALYQD